MRRRALGACVFGLLAIQTLLLSYSAKVHSPTWDEVGHLAAGLSHWQLGRFELYSVNPPLVRTIAAAPVAFISKPDVDWGFYRSDPSLRSEVPVGRRIIELNGEDSFRHFFYARLAVMPIALLGGLLCFLWARDLFGNAAGLVALTLWTFSPNVLAYGSLITPDLGSAVALLGSSYVFWRWLKEPLWSWSVTLGVAMALAMLTKSVWLVLPLVFAGIWSVRQLAAHRGMSGEASQEGRFKDWLKGDGGRGLAQFGAALVIAMFLTNGMYGFRGAMRPLGGFAFVSSTLSGNPIIERTTSDCIGCEDGKVYSLEPGNKFVDSLVGSMPVPIPANYLQGIDIQLRDFERGTYDPIWKSYLLGEWQQGGWWYYYVVALFLKVPLAIWVAVFLSTIVAIVGWSTTDQATRWGMFCLLVPAVAIFVIASAVVGFNRYMRYVLPVLPILIVWASQLGRLFDTERVKRASTRRIGLLATGLLCLWLIGATLANSPHHLSFFNAAVGGASEGRRYLCDSNIDWGQDLIHLQSWLETHPEAAENLSLAYFGGFDPAAVGIKFHPPRRLPLESDQPIWRLGPNPGWHVISVNYLVGHPLPIPTGELGPIFRSVGYPEYQYFNAFDPVGRIGKSLLVYHLSQDEVAAFRKEWMTTRYGGQRFVGTGVAADESTKSSQEDERMSAWIHQQFERQHG